MRPIGIPNVKTSMADCETFCIRCGRSKVSPVLVVGGLVPSAVPPPDRLTRKECLGWRQCHRGRAWPPPRTVHLLFCPPSAALPVSDTWFQLNPRPLPEWPTAWHGISYIPLSPIRTHRFPSTIAPNLPYSITIFITLILITLLIFVFINYFYLQF